MNIKVDVDKNIIVDVNYPVQVERDEFKSSFNGVKFQISSGLINAYKVAVDIVNDECTGTAFNIDNYVSNNLPLAFIERQYNANAGYFYYLKTIPEGDQEIYNFHFLVERWRK